MNIVLQHFDIWRADSHVGFRCAAIPTGYAALDDRLPGGGWPTAALIEVLSAQLGIGEFRLFAPALARLAKSDGDVLTRSVLAWIDPPHIPYAPALSASELDPAQQLIVKPGSSREVCWSMEQALRSGACSAVLGWAGHIEMRWLRRLKLAAVESGAFAVLFRSLNWRQQPSPATLRIALFANVQGLQVQLLKVQGGRPGTVQCPLR